MQFLAFVLVLLQAVAVAVVAVAMSGALIWTIEFAFKIRRHFRNKNRIWCACHVQDRIGLVPYDVLHRASRNYWRGWRSGARAYKPENSRKGELIRPDGKEVIVVGRDDPRVLSLFAGVWIQQAQFYIPVAVTPFEEAYRRIHGKPYETSREEFKRKLKDKFQKFEREYGSEQMELIYRMMADGFPDGNRYEAFRRSHPSKEEFWDIYADELLARHCS